MSMTFNLQPTDPPLDIYAWVITVQLLSAEMYVNWTVYAVCQFLIDKLRPTTVCQFTEFRNVYTIFIVDGKLMDSHVIIRPKFNHENYFFSILFRYF